MAAQQHIAEGNAAFVDEDFDAAVSHYSAALEEATAASAAEKTEALVRRSTALWKMGDAMGSLSDAKAALEVDADNARAWLRKGVACFELEEYESAKSAFEKGAALDKAGKVKRWDMWLRKCNAEIESERDEEEDEDAGNGEAAREPEAKRAKEDAPKEKDEPQQQQPQQKKKEQELSQESNNSPEHAIDEMMDTVLDHADDAPEPALANPSTGRKIRYEWFQTNGEVVVTVFVKNIMEEQAKVEIETRRLAVTIDLGDEEKGKTWELDLPLFQEVDKERSSVKRLSTKIEITLRKKVEMRWVTLEGPEDAPAPMVAAALPTPDAPGPAAVYPSSSKKKVNWDRFLAEQEDLDDEGDPLNKVFKDIYGKGSDEQRRAMVKSFVQSGGTVLSTNWEDVGKRDVEVTPPDGMIAKKWGED